MKRFVTVGLGAVLLAPLLALAQPYPNKPIRLLIPYGAGGTTDIMARALQEPLYKALGQPVVVENKAGASGVLAAREVARAKPDGYTLFFVNNGNVAVTPFVVKDAGYDAKDFAPVALVSSAPLFVVTNADMRVADFKGFIDQVKKQGQPITYASAGVGSFGHLSTELLAKTTGIKAIHVPYRGQAATTNALVAGEVKLLVTTASSAMNEFISAGRLKLLGVTSPEPSPLAPGAPTIGSFVPGYEAESWFAILTTAGTPPEIVNRLNTVINEILSSPDLQQRFRGFGVRVQTATPQRLGEMINKEIARWSVIVRENNIQAE
ncbi:MAG: tripartite tricarboxylate transporter substrate binding protein [Burkholderiales bacterium]|nr:tripartite tricarboxylate transporter substrate binding protein [Burkholderiales bacterium]